jgi:hypothetical protein
MERLLDVIEVQASGDYMLHLKFENGEEQLFDMAPYMGKKPFVRLNNTPLFMLAKVRYGTVVWPDNIDIAPETLYSKSVPI